MNHYFLLQPWEVIAFRDGSKSILIRPADRRRPEVGDTALFLENWTCYIDKGLRARYLTNPEVVPVPQEARLKVARAMFDSTRYLGDPLPAVLMPDFLIRLRRSITTVYTIKASGINENLIGMDGYRQMGATPRLGRYQAQWNERFSRVEFRMPSHAPVYVMEISEPEK